METKWWKKRILEADMEVILTHVYTNKNII